MAVDSTHRLDDTTDAPLDLTCWSARDLLILTAAIRGTKPRDPLRALEDAVLDLIAGA